MIDPRAIVDPTAELGPRVTIGPWATIGPNVRLEADARVGSHAVVADAVVCGIATEIAAHCYVAAGCRLGAGVAVMPATVVRQHVPAFLLVGREPARIVGVHRRALRDVSSAPEQYRAVRRAVRVLYRSDLAFADVLTAFSEPQWQQLGGAGTPVGLFIDSLHDVRKQGGGIARPRPASSIRSPAVPRD